MVRLFSKKTQAAAADTPAKLCPDCGCDLSGHHWNHCPRCHKELEGGAGCGGCGACGH